MFISIMSSTAPGAHINHSACTHDVDVSIVSLGGQHGGRDL